MGYEKFVIDADLCGAMHTYLRGFSVADDEFAIDAFVELGPANTSSPPNTRCALRDRVLRFGHREQRQLRAVADGGSTTWTCAPRKIWKQTWPTTSRRR